jgi:PST family polysaccharide transporter
MPLFIIVTFAICDMGAKYRKKLFSNFVAMSIIQGANFILPVLVMPVVIRRIGADGFGVVSVAQVVMIFLSTLTDYGFNLTATRDIAFHKTDLEKISGIFSSVLASKLILCGLTYVLLCVLTFSIPFFRSHFLLYQLGFAYVIGQSLLVSWFFQGMEKMQYITISTLFSRIIFVLLVLFFIRRPEDTSLFLLFAGIGNTIAGVFSIWLAFRIFRLRICKPLRADILHELKEGWQITVSNLSINTYQYINIIVLRFFSNDLIVGYYSIAERIFFAIRQILGIFSQVIYPHVCQLTREGWQPVVGFFKDFYRPFLLLLTLGCCGVFFFSPQIVSLLMGSRRNELPVLLLRMLAFVPVVVCLNIPAYQVLLAFNRKTSYLRILGGATVLNLLVNLLLCRFWGPVGTVLSIIVTELFVTIGLNWELYKGNLFQFIKSGIL